MHLIYVPCKNQKEAEKIGRKLVNENLACCANIVPEIYSIFKCFGSKASPHRRAKRGGQRNEVSPNLPLRAGWKGELSCGCESLLLIKTISKYEKVRKRIEQLHSYKVPAIAAFKLDKINRKYSKWAKKVQKH